MKKLLIFALPGGAAILLSWWLWRKFRSQPDDTLAPRTAAPIVAPIPPPALNPNAAN